ncbi:PIN domain-containing protein [Leptolyngbya sp. AN03gr2]|uniref:PIN domain-containing protein n=1 Tax=unclassified Leptolyngbya TaxID=2650499 RepID=UPI003D317A3A
MKKVFVLDTNVLLHDPNALFCFEELDRFKKNSDITGRNARHVSRTLDALREKGHLIDGIPLEQGGTLRVALCQKETLRSLPRKLPRRSKFSHFDSFTT